jgi:nucleoid-associated protein YejK
MQISALIIHEVIKEVNSTGATVYLSEEALDVTDTNIQNIVSSLESSFNKKTFRRAKFSEDGFKSKINDFTSYDLVEVSKELTKALKDNIQNVPASKGGYLVFAEYENNHNFLAVFLVRNTDGTKLVQSDNGYDLNSTQYLDVEHFAMGAKINLTILNSTSNDRYISLAKGNTDIAGYFEKWIGLDDSKQENKDAEALYKVSNHIDLPDGVERDELKKRIHDFAKIQPSKIINIRGLSQFLYEDENIIPDYCALNDIDMDGEFKLTGKNLNKFYKVSVEADNIKLSAPRSKFNQDMIDIDGDKVIINSSALVQQIQENIQNNEND